jgi:DNA-binding XRE family transcriptional regulator
MAKTLEQVMNGLPKPRRKLIERRGAELVQEQLTLQQLRRELNLTQEHMADLLEVKQGHVSKIEKRSDMRISTLRDYIEALGGELELVARIPGRKPVKLDGFYDATTNR